MKRLIVTLVAAYGSAMISLNAAFGEDPSAEALLKGVELARTQSDSLVATLTIEEAAPATSAKTINCRIELDGDSRRFEVLGQTHAGVRIRTGNESLSFRRAEHSDVIVDDISEPAGLFDVPGFDPRALGLSELMDENLSLTDCLWYDRADRLEIVGTAMINDIQVWRIQATRNDTTIEYWIEEPSFRVHRVLMDWPDEHVEVTSEFADADIPTPFPSRVVATRKSPRIDLMRIYTLESFEWNRRIRPERFTLTSMELPINTAVVDYRIDRIVGYWDGEGLSENPVYKGERPDVLTAPKAPPPAPGRSLGRLLLIGVNALIVVGLILIILWRRRGG